MNYNVPDRALKPQEVEYISKHVVTKNKQKEVEFCLTKKGLVKDLPAECKKVRKDFREYLKTLPKENKPKAPLANKPCKDPKKVKIDGRCQIPKENKPKAKQANKLCKDPKKVKIDGRCQFPKENKQVKVKAGKPSKNVKAKMSEDAELYVLTAVKALNPKLNTNVRLNEDMKSNSMNITALINPIGEKQSVAKYVAQKVKSGHMIPGDVVYIGTDYTSRPEYGFGIITGTGTIDTTFGPNDIIAILYGEKNDRNDVMKQLKTDFKIKHDKVLKKIFKFIDYLKSY